MCLYIWLVISIYSELSSGSIQPPFWSQLFLQVRIMSNIVLIQQYCVVKNQYKHVQPNTIML